MSDGWDALAEQAEDYRQTRLRELRKQIEALNGPVTREEIQRRAARAIQALEVAFRA